MGSPFPAGLAAAARPAPLSSALGFWNGDAGGEVQRNAGSHQRPEDQTDKNADEGTARLPDLGWCGLQSGFYRGSWMGSPELHRIGSGNASSARPLRIT